MSILRKRNVFVLAAALVVVVGAAAAIWGVTKLRKRSTSVSGQVTMYLLDERGQVDGLLLANGDQLQFSPQTGAVVATQIKVGDQVTVSGHAGSQTNYGREIRVETIAANGRTIVEAEPPHPHPHGPREKGGPKDRDERPDRDERADARPEVQPEAKPTPSPAATDAAANNKSVPAATPPAAAPTPEAAKATSTIGTHLVNGHGDVDGIILTSGEQVRFSPKLGKLLVAAEQGGSTQVSVEGEVVRNERGTVIRPNAITVGNQTFTVGR